MSSRRVLGTIYVTELLCLLSLIVGIAPAAATLYVVDRTDEQETARTCSDATPKDCSLRGAILAANANPGPDTILLPEGTYTLSLAGDELLGEAGDLDVTDKLTLQGASATTTVIQGCAPPAPATDCAGVDRLFHLHAAAAPITVAFSNVTIRHGSTKGDGGGILVDGGATLTLSRSVVEGNDADGAGGGIAADAGGVAQLADSVVAGNTSGGPGGGIFSGALGGEVLGGTSVSLRSSTVRTNIAGGGGGGVARLNGTLAISASTISGNTSGSGAADALAGSGGGVFIGMAGDGLSTITESTISGNTGQVAGGVAAFGSLVLSGCTIAANGMHSAALGAGGIASLGSLALRNTIVAGNTSDPGKPQNCAGTVVSEGYNLVGDDEACGGVTDGIGGDQVGTPSAPIDPRLGPLASNGGPTLTHALLPGSRAIEAGNPAAPNSGNGACSGTDQRGTPRPQPVGGHCDVGAFELSGSGTTTTTVTSTSSTSTVETSTTETTSTTEVTSTTEIVSTTSTTSTTDSSTTVSSTSTSSTSTSTSETSTSTTMTTSTSESTSTTTTTTSTTTTSTSSSTSSTSTSSSSSSSSSTVTTSSTSTSLPPPVEICGNCVDDNQNGFTDFEDPACCAQLQLAAMNVQKAGLAIAKGSTRLALAASLVQTGLSAGPSADQDVYLQLRQPGQPDLLCAHLPAASLTRRKTTIRFRDKKHAVASASGLDSLVLKGKKTGGGTLTVAGSRLAIALPPAGDVQITLGLRNPTTAEAENRCTTAQVALTAGRKGGLKYVSR